MGQLFILSDINRWNCQTLQLPSIASRTQLAPRGRCDTGGEFLRSRSEPRGSRLCGWRVWGGKEFLTASRVSLTGPL